MPPSWNKRLKYLLWYTSKNKTPVSKYIHCSFPKWLIIRADCERAFFGKISFGHSEEQFWEPQTIPVAVALPWKGDSRANEILWSVQYHHAVIWKERFRFTDESFCFKAKIILNPRPEKVLAITSLLARLAGISFADAKVAANQANIFSHIISVLLRGWVLVCLKDVPRSRQTELTSINGPARQ